MVLLKEIQTFNTYLNIITIYGMNGLFENYVQSNDYHGPDMTDFGHRSQQDPEFNEQYKEEMKNLKNVY